MKFGVVSTSLPFPSLTGDLNKTFQYQVFPRCNLYYGCQELRQQLPWSFNLFLGFSQRKLEIGMLCRTLLNRILFKLGQDLILIFLLNLSIKGSRIHSIFFSSSGDKSFLSRFLNKLHSSQKVPKFLPLYSFNLKIVTLMCTANHCSDIHSPVLPFSVEAFCEYMKAKLQGGFYFSMQTLISILENMPLKQELKSESMSVLLITALMCI